MLTCGDKGKTHKAQREPRKITSGTGHTAQANHEEQGVRVPCSSLACRVLLDLCIIQNINTLGINDFHFIKTFSSLSSY